MFMIATVTFVGDRVLKSAPIAVPVSALITLKLRILPQGLLRPLSILPSQRGAHEEACQLDNADSRQAIRLVRPASWAIHHVRGASLVSGMPAHPQGSFAWGFFLKPSGKPG
jgi:hypothetical protein